MPTDLIATPEPRPDLVPPPVPDGTHSGEDAPVAKLRACHVNFRYGRQLALKDVSVPLYLHRVTAFMGPSGCGKSTLLRVFNRMYDLYPDQHVEGEVLLDGKNVLGLTVDKIALRARIGMVFQKPTPFPMSIYDNVAFGIRLYHKLPAPRWTAASKRRCGARHCGTRSRTSFRTVD